MSIIDNAKEIALLIKKYNDQDLYQKIVDLRDEIFALKEENMKLKSEIAESLRKKDIGDSLVRVGNCYYKKDDNEHKQPFCMACFDYDGKLVNLIAQKSYGNTHTIKCNICMAR